MLSSVQFDYELSFDAGEIEDVVAERMLPSELRAIELFASQGLPEFAFGVSRVASKFSLALFFPDPCVALAFHGACPSRSEEHTSELQSLMRLSYALLCL